MRADTAVPLEAVVTTHELDRRASRPPDHVAENRVLGALLDGIANAAGHGAADAMLQRVAETALALCRADSAGVSILETDDGREVFRWHAAAGAWSTLLGGTLPRTPSPCDSAIEANAAVLMSYPERHYGPIPGTPPIVEALLVPFRCEGRPVGTVWAVVHDDARRFEREDERLLTRLAQIAAGACQLLVVADLRADLRAELARREARELELAERDRSQQALRESEQRFRALADDTPIMVWVSDAGGAIEFVNRTYRDFFGRDEQQARAPGGWMALVHPHDRAAHAANYEASLRDRAPFVGECRMRHADGSWRWIASFGKPRHSAAGEFVGHVGTSIDVTVRKCAEQALRQSESDARLLQSVSAELIAEDEVQAIYDKIIAAAAAIMRSQFASLQQFDAGRGSTGELNLLAYRGFTAEAAGFWQRVGMNSRSICGIALQERRRVVVADIDADPRIAGTEDHAVYRGTGIRAVQTTPLVSRSGTLVGMISTHWNEPHAPGERELASFDLLARQAADLIERRQIDAALRASERGERERAALLQSVLDTSPTPIWIALDPTCERILSNPAGDAVLGVARGANVSMAAAQGTAYAYRCFRDGVEIAAADLPMQRCAREGVAVRDEELEVVRADGTRLWLLMHASPLYEDGQVRGCIAGAIDITARKQGELALREADRRKDQFVATLAHELRNPLAPIRNAVQILRARGTQDPRSKWCREVIERQVQQMSRLLDDLLDVSRISHDKLELRKQRVELAAVIRNAVETCRPLIDSERHELTIALPAQPVDLDADPVRIAQVFANLLSNAAKYTEAGGTIAIGATCESGTVAVSVKDSGIGIPPDMLPHIFDAFSQATPARHRAQGGLGIGLSLVKGIVGLHGGTVEARSAGPLLGSEFVVTLPVAQSPAPLDSRSGLAKARSAALPRRRILVADDLRDSADSLVMILQALGQEVEAAYAGEQALRVARTFRPDIALLDIGMPDANGYDVCRRIRAETWGATMCLIALTGWGQAQDRRRSEEAGFDHHLVKPVDHAELVSLLASLPEK